VREYHDTHDPEMIEEIYRLAKLGGLGRWTIEARLGVALPSKT
jgi:hypothetical protein